MINATSANPMGPSTPSVARPTSDQVVSSPALSSPPPISPPPPKLSSNRKISPQLIIGVVVLIIVLVGAGAGLYLTQIGQDVRQQAATTLYGSPSPTSSPSSVPGGLICGLGAPGWDSSRRKCIVGVPN